MAKAKDPKDKETKDTPLQIFLKKFETSVVKHESLILTPKQLLRTGSLRVDLMLRGGLRAGTISEIYGPEGGAKTTLALHTTKMVLSEGGSVLYLDLERSLHGGVDYDYGHSRSWAEIIGVDLTSPNLSVARPSTGEEVYQMVEEAIKANLYDLIVLDSMAALLPRADLVGDIGESAFGKVAKLNSEALKRVLQAYDAQKVQKTHFMVINQARDTVGTTVKGMHSTGGRALRHYVSTKLKCTRIGKDPDTGMNIVSLRTDKNRFSPAWEECEIFIHPEQGIDLDRELLEMGLDQGIITKGGAYYRITDPRTGEELEAVQGKEQVRALFHRDPELRTALREFLWSEGLKTFVETREV